ncbi:MAG TPA: hypothetical protein PKG60_03460 [Spirochaetota bacterium]|nr:hypothetical protein [Spirochaetota bacterium]HPS86313.1 hypothetical protein [Spirochaetota bacterium]
MKRLLMVCIALVFTGNVFAQEVKQEEKKGPQFTYSAKLWAYGVSGSQKDYEYNYSHVRLRPLFTLGNENIKIVTQLEIDQDFGRGTDDNVNADPGTDNKVIEVKHAYAEAKDVILPNVSLVAGLAGYKFPLVVDNDFALFQAGYDFGAGKASLSYIKVDEYEPVEQTETETKQNKDVDAYALDLPVKIDSLTVRPGVIYIKGGDESVNFTKTSLVNYALNVTGDMGTLAFTATGAYMNGTLKDDGITKVKTSAYGIDLGVDVKPADGIKIGLFGTYGTGNDGKDAEKDNSYFYTLNKVFGKTSNKSGAPDGRLYLLENASVTSAGGYNDFDSMDNSLGYMAYGINAEAKIISKLTLFAQFGMASTVEKDAGGNTGIGSEIDLRAAYEIAPKSSLFLEYAAIIAGDDMGLGKYTTAENVSQIIWGVTAQI